MLRFKSKAKVLVVYKEETYAELFQSAGDAHLVALLKKGHADVRRLEEAHRVHQWAIREVTRVLRQFPLTCDLVSRAQLPVGKSYDLAVSVGGDGTFLKTARYVKNTPILGVNSNLSTSEAVFSAATVRTFPIMIRAALENRLPVLKLPRLRLHLNGQLRPELALNDVLIAHDHPATVSRYRLRIGSREEPQKSSGLWVATAAGSTSAVLAAGGARMSWGARAFQYRPRELYRGRLSRCGLKGDILTERTRIQITWLMQRGSIFVDGAHVRIPLSFGDAILVELSWKDSVWAIGLVATSRGRAVSRPR